MKVKLRLGLHTGSAPTVIFCDTRVFGFRSPAQRRAPLDGNFQLVPIAVCSLSRPCTVRRSHTLSLFTPRRGPYGLRRRSPWPGVHATVHTAATPPTRHLAQASAGASLRHHILLPSLFRWHRCAFGRAESLPKALLSMHASVFPRITFSAYPVIISCIRRSGTQHSCGIVSASYLRRHRP